MLTDLEINTLCQKEFPQNEDLIHLNHAAVGPWPRRSAERVKAFAEENVCQGSLDYMNWLKTETGLRKNLAQLINASVQEIALSKSTSEALSIVAYGLPWQAGDEVIITDQEFPSNRIVWESLVERFGVSLKVASLSDADSPEAAITSQVTAKTRLVSVSSVQYGTGLRLDLEVLGNYLRQSDILFCVDAIQSVGAMSVDVEKCHIDFLMADGHKWLLGPEGLALFYVRRHRQDAMILNQYGWHMVRDRGNYDRKDWEPADSAVRFECGSPNILAAHALYESTSLLLEVGMEAVENRIRQRIGVLADALGSLPYIEQITDTKRELRSGILTFRIRDCNHTEMFEKLKQRHILCAPRGGGLRFSPHFYNTEESLVRAVEILGELVAGN